MKISNFSELLAFNMSDFKGYSCKQKRRIFRRRSKEFRDRWKELYPRWLKHKIKRSGSGILRDEIMRESSIFSSIEKLDCWRGRKYVVPFDEKA